ncbi:Acyl-ACP thioesterase [Mycobacteroides abscessus subsp. abscessus]|uniref:Acyl-ACP thioesterase n=4 Tax=Mycobacteroides abscessus TaxID=36809 RepID=A0AB38D553_9MYCO|nr:acyl-CoA thioesterase [Mycobacteroides abscessus]ETZ88911.1 thioesterase superfamily protein [Mycobacteroides abscessus MAB_030201_1075]ETZ95485.1 thioesterase superfamily protein [Mycobacteroides abscessus MAB_030201_1061]EUA49663.1 thioesterase superfamily protein [Mycobacteroides abscessus 21]AKP57872.1 thioesterase [Mycobacteroides abscessus UC22]AMU70080.1 thioesterase [Mycobacteroides abscessus]
MGVEVKVELRWADMDAYRHVNNVAMFRLIEEARIRFLADKLMGVESGRITMFVAHQEIDYVQPLLYSHEPARVIMRATRIGTAGFGIGYEIIGADGAVAAIAETSMVVVDDDGRPAQIPEHLRAVLDGLRGEPVPFRRRRAEAAVTP